MFATLVAAAALAAAYDPVPMAPPAALNGAADVYQVRGPAVSMPCKVDRAGAVERVQLWVSDNRGKTWTLYEEITPDKTAFTFLARKSGEYWFTARLKKKDGTFDPADTADLVPMQRVAVETGTGYVPPAPAKPGAGVVVNELDDELTHLELELIRKEIKRLAEQKEFTRETEEKIDRLRERLRDARARLRARDDELRVPPLPPVPDTPDNRLVPPEAVPTAPPVIPMVSPAPPVAPMPRARG